MAQAWVCLEGSRAENPCTIYCYMDTRIKFEVCHMLESVLVELG